MKKIIEDLRTVFISSRKEDYVPTKEEVDILIENIKFLLSLLEFETKKSVVLMSLIENTMKLIRIIEISHENIEALNIIADIRHLIYSLNLLKRPER